MFRNLCSKQQYSKRLLTVAFGALLSMYSLGASYATAMTTSDWVTKAQGWMNARDNGAFTSTITTNHVSSTNVETWLSTSSCYFKDETGGWKMRLDTQLAIGNLGTAVYKVIDTPSGEKAWFDGVCVYPESGDLATGLTTLSHSSMPKFFFAGDDGDTPLEAITALTTSNSVSQTTLNSVTCDVLNSTFSPSACNALSTSTDHDMGTGDTLSGVFYIRSSDGLPVEFRSTAYDASYTTTVRGVLRWSNINTSPTIASNAFDLGTDTPSLTLQEAVLDWIDAHGG